MSISALKAAPEKSLMELMHKRDVKAMELVYDKYASLLLGMIQKIVCDRKKAEEILFKTFTYIWNHYRKYDDAQQTVCMWMIGIARKMSLESLSFYERKNIEHRLMDSLKQTGIKEEMTILELVFFQGVPVSRIAEIASCSASDVRTLLRQAIKKLKTEDYE